MSHKMSNNKFSGKKVKEKNIPVFDHSAMKKKTQKTTKNACCSFLDDKKSFLW